MPASHAIRRLTTEVIVPDRATAHRVAPLVSALIQGRLARLLERVFDACSGPDEFIHVDRLELDLGYVHLERLGDQIIERLSAALPHMLRRTAAQTRSPDQHVRTSPVRPDPSAAPLLLISRFLRTGTLPWWADTLARHALDDAVADALAASPLALVRVLHGAARDDASIERFVAHLRDDSLIGVARAIAIGVETLHRDLLPVLAQTPALGLLTPARLRTLTWRAVLRAALGSAGSDRVEAVLTDLASAVGTTLAAVAADINSVIGGDDHPLAGEIAAISNRYPPAPRPLGFEDADALIAAFDVPSELATLFARLRPLSRGLSAAGVADLATAVLALSGAVPDPARIAALLRPFAREGLIQAAEIRGAFGPLVRSQPDPPRCPPSMDAEDEDARLVATAGLGLLWPFLPRFFGRLGLLDEAGVAFPDMRQAHRAVQVLHYLATGEAEAPEYALVLEKVLCGLEPHAPHVLDRPVGESERDEAHQLLGAVIAHANCLGDISPDGLRGSFLIRRGILSTRDGAWLLRVERQAQDVLLQRLPWTIQWARLPWMSSPMRVEW